MLLILHFFNNCSVTPLNKLKIINDPVYGFITIPTPLIFDLIEHPWFQRLRRIRQLGLTCYTYPSAHHTRFQHALGAMHLMNQAIGVLRSKGIPIPDHEAEALCIAILLHDIGHGPYSHTLEQTLVRDLSHEEISGMFIEALNRQFDGKLETALAIFRNRYSKPFLHQLVSSQLDMDRLDYLARDSFFTGVAEGVISHLRIINMLTVSADELVVEEKGIYSIEKFLISRRLMYWQVYLHKTVIAADQLLLNILRRAQLVTVKESSVISSLVLQRFLLDPPGRQDFLRDPRLLDMFASLDDADILAAIKNWQFHSDPILSELSGNLINRRLPGIEMQSKPFSKRYIRDIRQRIMKRTGIQEADLSYYFTGGMVENKAYNPLCDKIMIKGRDNALTDIFVLSEQLNKASMPTTVSKYYLSYPKEIRY